MASCPLLRKVVGPSQELQDRANQFLLGDGLVGAFGAAQRIVALTNAIPKHGKCRRVRDGRPPLGGRLYAFGQEVVREQIAGHVRPLPPVSCHHSKARPSTILVIVALCTELSYPAHAVNPGAYRPVESLVGGPQFAAKLLR